MRRGGGGGGSGGGGSVRSCGPPSHAPPPRQQFALAGVAPTRRVIELAQLSSDAGVETLGRNHFGLEAVRTLSRQHLELSRDGSAITVRSLHKNAIRIVRLHEDEGMLLSKSGPLSRALLRPGDLLEIGDVCAAGDAETWTYRLLNRAAQLETPVTRAAAAVPRFAETGAVPRFEVPGTIARAIGFSGESPLPPVPPPQSRPTSAATPSRLLPAAPELQATAVCAPACPILAQVPPAAQAQEQPALVDPSRPSTSRVEAREAPAAQSLPEPLPPTPREPLEPPPVAVAEAPPEEVMEAEVVAEARPPEEVMEAEAVAEARPPEEKDEVADAEAAEEAPPKPSAPPGLALDAPPLPAEQELPAPQRPPPMICEQPQALHNTEGAPDVDDSACQGSWQRQSPAWSPDEGSRDDAATQSVHLFCRLESLRGQEPEATQPDEPLPEQEAAQQEPAQEGVASYSKRTLGADAADKQFGFELPSPGKRARCEEPSPFVGSWSWPFTKL